MRPGNIVPSKERSRQYRPSPRGKAGNTVPLQVGRLAIPTASKGRDRQYRPPPRGEAGNTVLLQGERLAIPSSSKGKGWQYRPPLPLEGERLGEGVGCQDVSPRSYFSTRRE
jgi:hypothetical protein